MSPANEELIAFMVRPASPRFVRAAACLALEGRHLVMLDRALLLECACPRCARPTIGRVRALHREAPHRGAVLALLTCSECGLVDEARPLAHLASEQAPALEQLGRF